MKTTLILSALAAVLSVTATTSFAQNFVNYPSAYGSAKPPVRTVAPIVRRFTDSDFAYQGVARPRYMHTPGR